MTPEVCIDARMIRASGIGTYLQGLIANLQHLQPRPDWLSAIGDPTQMNDLQLPLLVPTQVPIYSLREQWVVPRSFRRSKAKLLHLPHYNVPIALASECVVTVHDLIHLKFPQYLKSKLARIYADFFFEKIVPRCREIMTVSEFTKQDLVTTLGYPATKITVCGGAIASGIQRVSKEDRASRLSAWGIDEGYFLYVGNLKETKNTPLLLHAYEMLLKKVPSVPPLVLVGKNFISGFEASIRSSSNVVWLGPVAPDQLSSLYSGAGTFLFPSLYEGFGMPPLEAMACGIPVASSNRASLPEVLGEAALYFDPENEQEMIEAMRRTYQDRSLRESLIAKGYDRVRHFSWLETARRTLAVYQRNL